jgi:DHA2 family multidrug resistance protein
MTTITQDWDFYELLWPQIFRGVGLMLSIVPVTNTALGTLSPDRIKNASGLFNLMRNLGGAIGLAAINTVLNDRMDLHLARLHEAVNYASVTATETLNQLTQKFGGSDGALQALKQMSLMARKQALVMSFGDVFVILTALFVVLAAAGVMMKKPVPVAAGSGAH